MRAYVWALLAFSVSAVAQQAAPASPATLTGQVMGHVVCGDTNQPARFATVQLIGEHPPASPIFDTEAMAKDPDFEKSIGKAMAAVMKGGNSNLSAVTALDGAFTMEKVPPGNYLGRRSVRRLPLAPEPALAHRAGQSIVRRPQSCPILC